MRVPKPLAAGAVRIEWRAREDRVGHVLQLFDGAKVVAALESIDEPRAAQDGEWPPAPPLAEWHCEQRAGLVAVALGVGRAGKSHWSAAVELAPDGTIRCDIAVRVAREPGCLGSQYRALTQCRLIAPGSVELAPGWLLGCDPAATSIRLEEQGRLVVVEPIPDEVPVLPRTIRWRYWIGAARAD